MANAAADNHGVEPLKKPTDAESAYGASTILADAEKQKPSQTASGNKRPGNLFGSAVDTGASKTSGLDPAYVAKAQLLNEALLDIGMGRYQWFLTIATAVGWFLDQFWLASFTIILPAASNEAQFYFLYQNPTDFMISTSAGLALGALMWPVMADIWGRKQMFTATVVLMGMAGLVGAGMTAFTGLCVVGFVVGFAVGGNQAVDAVYLVESVPASHTWLVAAQGVFWGLGQLVAYAVGWAFLEQWTCGTGPDASSGSFKRADHTGSGSGSGSGSSSSSSLCHYVSNKGWRYTWWCFGCITLFLYLVRFSIRMYETPKSLLARRRDDEAVQTTRDIANANRQITWLNEAAFARVESSMITEEAEEEETSDAERAGGPISKRGLSASIKSVVAALGPMGLCSLVLLWASIGLTFTLQSQFIQLYLATKGVSAVTATSVSRPYWFSRYVYISICAIPGPLIASALVEAKFLGRKRAGALLSLLSGIFMLASTGARTRNSLLAFECILSFLQYALLAVVTLYTVEVFGAPIRGAGIAVTGLSWRFFGLVAWIVAGYSSSASGAAVWFSGALAILVSGLWILLPVETRAKAAA
ncbi:major facilitator superfamily domain-containing protein [Coniella lustricola]|uniref:Major facilitator superfamily domain-containing protein n=1 Tax=Coniella lustricola TaxID=2025994 RepID=A0A2T3ANL3_9PEZI|nr:major facilitator superfamily domain-containing protein [Coniella lustricola]